MKWYCEKGVQLPRFWNS